jgi:Arylsulfotransferase (ASST)
MDTRGEIGLSRRRFVQAAAGASLAVGGGAYGAWRVFDRLDAPGRMPATTGLWEGVRRFHSRPDLRPPAVTALRRRQTARDDLLFLTPLTGPGQRGTLIIESSGEPVWFRPATVDAANLNVASYRGAPVLTWWEGKLVQGGVGDGQYVIADRRYRTVARFRPGLGYYGDLHEFLLTPEGTALVTVHRTTRADLRAVGGARDGEVIEMGFQEIDVATGEVLLHWSGLDHVPVDESHLPLGGHGPYDYLHLNSVDLGPEGTILVSARHTWTVYSVDRASGRVLWRLGGKRSSFAVPAAARFAWQHDARWHGTRTITLFDDGAGPDSHIQPQSRGLVLDLDQASGRVSLARAYEHSPGVLADAMGSMQVRPGGGAVVGFGSEPYLTLFGTDGEVDFDARLPPAGSSYRSLAYEWSGHPVGAPALAVATGAGARRLYVSWNGATGVAAWQLLTGRSADRLTAVDTAPAVGFETALDPGAGSPRYAAAVALDAAGRPIGRSRMVAL